MKGLHKKSSYSSNLAKGNSRELFFDNNLAHYYEDFQQFHKTRSLSAEPDYSRYQNAVTQLHDSDYAGYHTTGSIKTNSNPNSNSNSNYNYNNQSVRSKFASYHVYQRSSDRSIVFKSGKDALVFISVVKVKAIKLGILVYSICLMDNHIHMLVKVRDKSSLHRFVTDYTSLFAKLYNKRHNRSGMLFSTPFGRAYKKTDKYIRNCICYINNNSVEAHKTKTIEEYIWNLFSFANSSHPHSEALNLSKARKRIRFCCRVLKAEQSRGRHLAYELLDEVFSSAEKSETSQLVDYILNLYNPVDYSAIKGLYGNLDKASLAINANTGSEYEIVEDDIII